MMAGCERKLFLAVGLVAGLLIFAGLTWWSVVAGLGLWSVLVAILRAMGKADPQLSQVYARHMQYRSYYGGSGTPWL